MNNIEKRQQKISYQRIGNGTVQGRMGQRVAIGTKSGSAQTAVLMEQTFHVLGKQELLKLEQVHDCYLLEELRSRGYELGETSMIRRMERHQVVESIYRLLVSRKTTIFELLDDVYKYLFNLKISQVEAAKLLGTSNRSVCYHYKKIREGKPVGRPMPQQRAKEESHE